MKNVISISLGAGSQDFRFTAQFLGEHMTVRRLGTDGRLAAAEKLIRQWDGKADAIGLGVAKDGNGGGWMRRQAQDAVRLAAKVNASPVTTGERLGEIFLEWAVRHTQIALGQYFNNAKVLFFSGLANQKLAASMAEYTDNFQFADPVLQLGVPKLLTSLSMPSASTRGGSQLDT